MQQKRNEKIVKKCPIQTLNQSLTILQGREICKKRNRHHHRHYHSKPYLTIEATNQSMLQ